MARGTGRRPGRRRPPPGQWPRLVAIALSAGVLHFSLSFWSLKLAGNLSAPAIVLQSYVPMSVLLAWALLGERFGWRTGAEVAGAWWASARLALIDDGKPALADEFEVGAAAVPTTTASRGQGYPVKTPVISLIEIGAGGGSIAQIDPGGALTIGPESAGADPGPACYGRGGTQATVTSPMRVAATPRMPSSVVSSASRIWRSWRSKSRPTTVRLTRRVLRSSSRTPSACSSLSMRRLNAGCEMWTDSAALRKLPSSATARKASRSLRSKLMAMKIPGSD